MSELELNRRQLLLAGAGLMATAYGLSGCTVERPLDKSAAGSMVEPKIDGDLLIFNWAQYMDPAIKKSFSDKYGVAVNEVNFDNLEAMVTKLRAGGAYDLIFPSTEYVQRLRDEQLIRPFDRAKLKNADTLSPFYDSPWYDPNSEFSVPYAYYTTGIAWNTEEVTTMTESWADMSNPEALGRIFMLDDFQEGIGQANLLNGFYLNTTKSDELETSKETLLDQKEGLRGFNTNSVQTLVSGAAALTQAWNGDVVNARNQVDDPSIFAYQTCKEGAGRLRPDEHPGHLEESGHGDDVHGLGAEARERLQERDVERISAAGRGCARGFRRTGQGRPVDRRRSEPARRHRDGVQARQSRSTAGVDPPLDRGEGMTHKRFWEWFIFPGGIWIALLFAIPLFLVLALSFGHVDDFGRGVYGFSLDNYKDVFDATYVPVLLRSVGYALATVVLCLLIGYPVAYFIARYGGRYRYALLAALVIPFFVNYLVRTYAWVALLADQGLVNNLLVDWGLTESPIQMINTPYAVIGGLVYGYIIFMILPLYGSIERMDPSVIEAGKDLYGSPLQTFIHVTLPATQAGILAGCVLVFLPAVGDFVSAQLLGGPDTYMVGNLIQDQFFAASNWPFGSALTVVMMIFLAVWMVFYLRRASKGEAEVL